MKTKQCFAVLTVMIGLLSAVNCWGAAISFNVTSGDWNTPGNWSPAQKPVAGDAVTIPTGRTVTGLGGANQACTSIVIQGTGSLTVDANTLTLSGNLTVGSSGAAVLTIASGASMSVGGTFGFGGTGSHIDNNGTFSCAGGGTFSTGTLNNNGTATFSGSAQAFNGSMAVVQGANATLNITANNSTPFGGSSTLTATASGNTVSYTAAQNMKGATYFNLSVSGNSPSAGSSTIVNGTLRINLNSGQQVNSANNITMGANSTILRILGTLNGTPTFPGSPNYVSVIYANTAAMTTGVELPANIKNLTLTNTLSATSANKVTLNTSTTVNGTFAATYLGTPAASAGATVLAAASGKTVTFSSSPVALNFPGTQLASSASYTVVSGGSTFVSGTLGSLTLNGAGAPLGTPSVAITSGTLVLTVAAPVTTYTVSYNANGGTGSQTDGSSPYNSGATVTVLGTGSIARTGYTFSHWNTVSDGSGTSYAPAATFSIAANTTLYAIWTINTYPVSYNANGGTGSQTDGSSPYNHNATVTVLGTGSIARTGYTFAHWNTASDGSGTSYNPSDTFSITANTTLYAIWTINNYSVSYDGNGSDGGTTPTTQNGDYNTSVTAAASTFTRTSYSFTGWNTAANGSGTAVVAGASYTIPAANTTLYAQWAFGCAAPDIVGGIDASATTLCAGSPVILTLTNVTGSEPLFYQWQTNNVDLTGATNVSYTNLTVALTDAADYTCVVTNDCGSITSAVVTLTVNLLPSAPTAGDVTVTYDGAAHTGTATPAGGSGVKWFTAASGGSVTSPPSGTNVGTYTAYAAATNDMTGCESATRTLVTVQINKADASVTVTPYSVTYDGNPHTATAGTVTGVNGETGATVGTVNLGGTTHTNAGSYPSDSWTLTGGANYNNISATTISNNIAKAAASVTVTPYNVVYDGNPHTATAGTVTGVNGETGATVGTVDLSGTTHTAVGVYTNDFWTLTGGANYNNIPSTTITNIITPAPTSYALTNSGAWNVAANWSPNGTPGQLDTVTINTGKTLTGLGGANQSCASLTIQGTGVLIVDANALTVTNAISVGSSGAANLTIESGGILTITGTGSAAWGFGGTGSSITNHGIFNCSGGNSSSTGNFVNNGTATFTGNQQSFNNSGNIIQGPNAVLNLNGSVTTPIGSSPTISFTNTGNTVSYGAAATDVNTKGATYYNLTFTGGGRRSMGNPTVINNKLSIQGSVNDVRFGSAPTYAAGATLEYKSSVAQTQGNTSDAFPASGGPANLIIDNSSGFTLSAARTITGTVTLAAGTFSSANNLTLGNGATIVRTAGIFSGTPSFGSSVNVTYNNTSSTTTGTELPTSSSVLNNLTINNPAGVVLNANRTVNGTFSATYNGTTPPLAAGGNTLALVSSPVNITVTGGALVSNPYTIVSSSGTTVSGTLGTVTVTGDGAPYSPAPTASTASGQLVLTIAAALTPTSVAVTSSANPAGYLSTVELVAAVTPATATGTIQFKTNGVTFGSPIALADDGKATNSTSALLRGTNVVTADYSGDDDHDVSTGTLSPDQVITNHPPAAANLTLGVVHGGSVSLLVIGGKHAPTDVDGDSLTVTGVGTASSGTSGFTLSNVTYTADGDPGTNMFTYTVSDGLGGTDTKTVTVVVTDPQGFNQISATNLGGNTLALAYLGIPGTHYSLDWATNISAPINWMPVITNAAQTNGWLYFTNTGVGTDFYRTRYVP